MHRFVNIPLYGRQCAICGLIVLHDGTYLRFDDRGYSTHVEESYFEGRYPKLCMNPPCTSLVGFGSKRPPRVEGFHARKKG